MSTVTLNVIVSGVSVSGNLDVNRQKVIVDLGNSDKIGRVQFALENTAQSFTGKLFSGNATVQVDAMLGGTVIQTMFRGTLEESDAEVNTKQGSVAVFTGYDYGQELLGLITPDARQKSAINSNGTMSLTSGEQGMGSLNGMDMVLFVSGVIGSGSTGSITSGAQLNLFMSQYFGRSGDTTGSNSGQSFSFKPYLSGMVTSGVFPGSTYKTWYVADTGGGAGDTNANYWIPYDVLKVKHETAWDVLRKLTRQGFVVDRAGLKVAFEVFIGVSGDIHLRTSGTSDGFASGISLVYYVTGNSGSANNNLKDAKIKFNTTNIKNDIQGWFPTWTQYPFGDDYTDFTAYSGAYWSGQVRVGTFTLSGNVSAPNAPGFISLMMTNDGGGSTVTGSDFIFTLWSGYTLNIQKWNVSGGIGVTMNWLHQISTNATLNTNNSVGWGVVIADTSGNFIVISGGGAGNTLTNFTNSAVNRSGWNSVSVPVFTGSGTFFSGDGLKTGWAATATFPDLTSVKLIKIGTNIGTGVGGGVPTLQANIIDNLNFQFAFNYNPVVAFTSGSISSYGRRYEVFEFPYETTDSGAASIVLTELQSKEFTRGISEFVVKDNPNLGFSAQLGITPGQIFFVDAPSLGSGSGQFFNLFRAIDVRHEWSHQTGLETFVKATSFTSGSAIGSGFNLILYSLPLPAPLVRPMQTAPITHWWLAKGG